MRALSVWRALGDRREEAATLSVIGSLYYSLGDVDRRAPFFTSGCCPFCGN